MSKFRAVLLNICIQITVSPVQLIPFPVNPTIHVQMKVPSVLLQVAFSSQGLNSLHSLISGGKNYIVLDKSLHFL